MITTATQAHFDRWHAAYLAEQDRLARVAELERRIDQRNRELFGQLSSEEWDRAGHTLAA